MELGFDMIVSCPSCAKRYEMDHVRSNRPLQMACSACGHRWKELPGIEVIDLEYNTLPLVIDHAREPELDVQRLVEAAKTAKQRFAAKKVARLKKLSAWISLAFLGFTPFATAAFMPEAVVGMAPITIKAYEKLGLSVNLYGLDIRHVAQENKIVDGAHVLMIKGEVSNSTDSVRKMPWLRFALLGDQNQELYAWTLDTAARPLRPGETTSFVTRVAAPPELAKNLQIRFAHADEIGSNPKP
jgi:hypothetical protein